LIIATFAQAREGRGDGALPIAVKIRSSKSGIASNIQTCDWINKHVKGGVKRQQQI
jgi:hypothetical protein